VAELRLGLEGVAVAQTNITCIEGEKGRLIYRGELIEDIVKNHTFEEVVYLLWNGEYPNNEQLKQLKTTLSAHREIPGYIKDIIKKLPKNMSVMSVLRTAISAIEVSGPSWPPTQSQAIEILAKAPTIITYYRAHQKGTKEILPDSSLDHVENYLYMLYGKKPEHSHVKALEAYLILSADHDINASTFTARVVTSTQSDIVSSVVAAIGALKGPLHGGAPSEVDNMLDDIGSEENVEPWLRKHIENGDKIMGFGHRVYKTFDPRGAALKEIVKQFSSENKLFKLSLIVEEKAIQLLNEYKPGRKLYPNVEFWAAGVLRTILPVELYTPTFCVSRIAGWCAQIMEQAANNRIIRPSSIYTGKMPK
jgi:citrate synthase